ncbi:hypothetical protein DMC25_25810 [Caulobacter sp. D4A]|uniref:hypothetical protein n=1 Tax=unclassified Caulobacter TaxID=2648921 RepID=UPI000D73CB09|nr:MULTISPECIES: hypothetical protein [unclassified Caulobacter]PXA73842.1 hypothetical protein DMC25_25810 [Caulobacter sp. D4A]PXA89117.1 hypothetical protein DMC18_17790 [Caulobacter sp. D5]
MILIENAAGSSQVITIIEEFAGHSISRDLQPGDAARIPVGQFKSIVVRETYPDDWMSRVRSRQAAA